MKDEIIINQIAQDRTLKQSSKYQRKRGVIIKDKNGEPKVQTGDTVRGKLHDESIFGMIKMPETELREGKHRLKMTDGKLTFTQNENRPDKDFLFVVKKVKINDLKLEDFETIVIDPNLGMYLKNEVERRMKEEDQSFEKALKGLYAFGKSTDKNGNPLQPMRHVRCKVKGGRGFIVNPIVVKPIEGAFLSKNRNHKRHTYALNGEVPYCALYEWDMNGEIEREIVTISVLEAAKSGKYNSSELVEKTVYATKGAGKNKVDYTKQLVALLHPSQQVIFYKNELTELKELHSSEKNSINNRVYTIVKFNDRAVFFKHNMTALAPDGITKAMLNSGYKKECTKVEIDKPILYYKLAKGELKMAIQDVHFELKSDGQIKWLF